MAKKKPETAKKKSETTSKKSDKAKQNKKALAQRRRILANRQNRAMENNRERLADGTSPMGEARSVNYSNTTDSLVGGKIQGTEVDARFAADMQKMKFCRKPVGFLMWLLYLVLIVALAAPFVLPKLNLDLGIPVEEYLALCTETEKAATEEEEGEDAEDEESEDEEEDVENAAFVEYIGILTAEEDETDEETEEETDGEEEGEEDDEETESSGATVYSLSDPLFGWIKYVAGLFGADLDETLGETPWYDAQISKTESLSDPISVWLIRLYPLFIVIYALLALTLMVQTFICFASGDRRIFRFTGIENLAMLLCAAVVMIGCYASTVEVSGTLDFSGVVDFLIGGLTGVGGLTAGYGMLIMLGIPVLGFILSFFLLEKKLRGREITQPIVVYHYKEK